MSLEKINLLNDIYYKKEYISLYLREGESVFDFYYSEDNDFFYNIAIKRPIRKIGNKLLEDCYFDLETVYGYGGFYTNSRNRGFVERAIEKYSEKCFKQNIISEFFRFHPMNSFVSNYYDIFDMVSHDRDLVCVDLETDDEKRFAGYTKTTRNIIRKGRNKLSVEEVNSIDRFSVLYNSTMIKNSADKFYFFDEVYFKKLLDMNEVVLLEASIGSDVLSSSFFLMSSVGAYYHLSGNDYSRTHNGNYVILDKAFEMARKKGLKFFLLGGGSTNLDSDSLLAFKKKFSKDCVPFYIGGKIYNREIYRKYISVWEQQSTQPAKYFLKYRLDIK